MQNEPNLQNAQINLTPSKTTNYANLHPLRRRKNEPNFRTIASGENPVKNYKKILIFARFQKIILGK